MDDPYFGRPSKSGLTKLWVKLPGATDKIAETVADEYLSGNCIVSLNTVGKPFQVKAELDYQIAMWAYKRTKELSKLKSA